MSSLYGNSYHWQYRTYNDIVQTLRAMRYFSPSLFCAKKLEQLPPRIIETLKVASCFGSQVNESIIRLLGPSQFVEDMTEALELAEAEGIIEKAGPIFAFSHDMLQESTYNLISSQKERTLLHKKIAMSLVRHPEVLQDADRCTVTADQINRCADVNRILDSTERALFARLNLTAGQHAMHASSYGQAWGYFEAGIVLLNNQHWDQQYFLSLQLYEMSAVASFTDGNIDTVTSRLDEILSHARSFDDRLTARALLAQSLAAQGLVAKGVQIILEVLSGLGEIFPRNVTPAHVSEEMTAMLPQLRNVTEDWLRNLPVMTDVRKLNAMKVCFVW